MNIYVGNLPYLITEEELQKLFSEYGSVDKVNIIKDSYTQESKGFGFVEMEKQADAEEAIKKLNGSMLNGRNLKVNQARPKSEGSRRRSRSW